MTNMKTQAVTLLRAVGSVLVLSPALAHSAPATQNNAYAFRKDAKSIKSDFDKAASRLGVKTCGGNSGE